MPKNISRTRFAVCVPAILWFVGRASELLAATTTDVGEFFEREVRPILVSRCFQCHSDDEPEHDLRLTSRENILTGGKSGPAANLKSPRDSLILQAVLQMSKLKMPPDGRLPDREIGILSKWLELGAPWPTAPAAPATTRNRFQITDEDRQHWAFRALDRPSIPQVEQKGWPQTGLDRFALHAAESAALTPNSAADRRTLIRRLYYDLVGVPPSWEEVSEFESDSKPLAISWEQIVDRLLASPMYGEKWGRHWLDVARFADTKDGVLMYGDARIRPFAYTYRDYVIRALNEDTPYNRFVHEQLAADLITPQVEPWRLAALGFLTLGRMYDNNIHDIIDDQIDTVCRGFLGLTVACARCHDHKYDPISTADYYSLYGVFASCENPIDLPLLQSPFAESREFEAAYVAKQDEILKFREEQFGELRQTAQQRTGDYLLHVATTKPDPLETAIFFLSLAPEDLRPPIIAKWRRYLAQPERVDDPIFGAWVDFLGQEFSDVPLTSHRILTVRQDWLDRPEGNGHGQVNPRLRNALMQADLKSRSDVARFYAALFSEAIEESKSPHKSPETALQPFLTILDGPNSPTYFPKSQTRRYMSRQQTDKYGKKIGELDGLAVTSKLATPRAMVVRDSESLYEPRIFVRGNPSQPGRAVPKQFLELLEGPDRSKYTSGSGRLELAKSITDVNNPLTARVFVNRIWMHHFGEPLVSSPSDLGRRSTPPQHLELLDFLSRQFMENEWSVKRLHRQILLSAAWQQESISSEHGHSETIIAPRRQRLSFEAMRDAMLVLSGRLEQRYGGRPADLENSHSRRRSVYGLVDRQSLPGVFRAFDFASPDQSVERRARTMVPQQTLFALNGTFVIEQAKGLVAELPNYTRSDARASSWADERVTQLFRRVLLRDPTPFELAGAVDFVELASDSESTLPRWEQLAQVLLCSNELMYLD